MGYEGSLITDSGGFQVRMLHCCVLAPVGVLAHVWLGRRGAEEVGSRQKEARLTCLSSGVKTAGGGVKKISEEGVVFRNYRDGSKMLLTPESSVQLQKVSVLAVPLPTTAAFCTQSFGADIIIPFDELPPFHISAEALQASFDRTHRYAWFKCLTMLLSLTCLHS
jgi:tRNA-guanine family transglycosylase